MVGKIIDFENCPYLLDAGYFSSATHASVFEPATHLGMIDDNTVGTVTDYIKEGTRAVRTSEDVIALMNSKDTYVSRIYYADSKANPLYWSDTFADGEAIPPYLRRPSFAWDGSGQMLLENINNGVKYVMYDSHGQNQKFSSGGFEFGPNEISHLISEQPGSIFFNFTCLTGSFYNPYNSTIDYTEPCMAELLLKRPTWRCFGSYCSEPRGLYS